MLHGVVVSIIVINIIAIITNITFNYLNNKIGFVEVTFSGWPPLFTFSGRENPLTSHPLWLGSAARLTLALDSLSLTSPCHPTAPLRPPPRCTLLHQPSLRPGVFSPLCRQVRVDLGPALNRPSLQPPPGSALTLAIPRPLVSFLSTPVAPPAPLPPSPPTTTISPHVAAP